MTEEFKDFFKNLRDRVSNPLIGSFIISWLSVNWQIPVALLFSSEKTLANENYTSYLDLIRSQESLRHFFVIPAVFALAYTIFFPLVRSQIKLYNARVKAENEATILTETGDKPVSLKKYIRLLDDLKKEQDRLADIENLDKDLNEKIIELNFKLREEESKRGQAVVNYEELSRKIYSIQTFSEKDILSGNWSAKYQDGRRDLEQWYIRNNVIAINNREEYQIVIYISNPITKQIAIILSPTAFSSEPLGRHPKMFFQATDNLLEFISIDPEPIYGIKLSKFIS